MSEMFAPQWFKDAVRDWPTACFVPLAQKANENTFESAIYAPSLVGRFEYSGDAGLEDGLWKSIYVRDILAPFGEFGIESVGINGRYLLRYTLDVSSLNTDRIIVILGNTCHLHPSAQIEFEYEQGSPLQSLKRGMNYYAYPNFSSTIKPVPPPYGFARDYDTARISPRSSFGINPEDMPEAELHSFQMPQHRALVLGTGGDEGALSYGYGHPKYTNSRDVNLGYYHAFSSYYLEAFDFNKKIKKIHVSAYAGDAITFVEVLTPNIVGCDFDYSAQGTPGRWWRDAKLVQEMANARPATDRYGFPIG